MTREFKLWNKKMTQYIGLSNNDAMVSDVNGLGNLFNNIFHETDNPNKTLLKQLSAFEDIALTITFGIKENTYASYHLLMRFIAANKKQNLTLEYKTSLRTVYVDVVLANAPKTQKNEFGVLTETITFKRITPFYKIKKLTNITSCVINNGYVENILPKITVRGSGVVQITYTTSD